MANSRYKHYMVLLRKITDYNNRNNAPLSNENIREAVHEFIAEEELYAHNVTVDDHNVTTDAFS